MPPRCPAARPQTACVQLRGNGPKRPPTATQLADDVKDSLLCGMRQQRLSVVPEGVAEGDVTGPQPLRAFVAQRVPGALTDGLTLPLRDACHHVEHQPPCG